MDRANRVGAIISGFILSVVGVAGCASQGGSSSPPKETSLRVSGSPGTRFTVEYRVGSDSRRVTITLTESKTTATVVELNGDDLGCNVRKLYKSMSVIVGIYRDGRCLFQTECPAGTQGTRIARIWGGWKAEEY